MKVWLGFGSEHSSNLVIIGKFKTTSQASDSLSLIKQLTDIALADQDAGLITPGAPAKKFSDKMLSAITQGNGVPLSYQDPEQLLYEYELMQEEQNVIITTEELSVEVFLKILIQNGARVEIYSAHDHPSPYGR